MTTEKFSRSNIELLGTLGAAVLSETDKWKLVRVLGRIHMYIDKRDKSVGPHLEREGFWESWITRWFYKNVGLGTVFWDVGANTGYYSFLSYLRGARVMAFEPNPDYFEMMEATIYLNKWNIKVSDKALSDVNGSAKFHIPEEFHGGASLRVLDDKWHCREVDIETVRFDNLVRYWGAGRQVMKIDAEGAEEKIIDGMGELLKKPGRPIILMEYTPGAYSPEFLDKLEAYAPLAWVNHSGDEEPVSRESLAKLTDWIMLVLRPR